MPQLLPQTIFRYHADWIGPGGRLVWAVLITTIGLLWVMMLMKRPAVKNKLIGPGFLVVGTSLGASMAIVGKTILEGTLTGNTLIPFGFMIAWFCFFGGIWAIFMAAKFEPLSLPVSRLQQIGITALLMAGLYVLGGFVHSISVLTTWLAAVVLLASISLVIWSLPRRERDATWVEAIVGGLLSFILMTMIYAIIPHEFITFANSYLGWTKDIKLSAGGEFVLQSWFDGDFWTKQTRIIPFELNMEVVQDHATTAIYVITATINIKLFAAWQKRNEPIEVKEKEESSQSTKTSRFGRPLRAMKASKA